MTKKDTILIKLRNGLLTTGFITFSELQKQKINIKADLYAVCNDIGLKIDLSPKKSAGVITYLNLYNKEGGFQHTFDTDSQDFTGMLKESFRSFISYWAGNKLKTLRGE